MSTCSIAYGIGKDTSANFVTQLRDSSDVTRMKRQQGVKRNYQNLSSTGKNELPVGGISHTHLLDMAHTTQAIGPSNALLPAHGYIVPACVTCSTTLSLAPFSPLYVSRSLIRY